MSVERSVPERGTIVTNGGDSEMIVYKHADKTAGDYTFNSGGSDKVLTEVHDCPPDEPVVEVVYAETLDHLIADWAETYNNVSRSGFLDWLESYTNTWPDVSLTDDQFYGFPVSALDAVPPENADSV